MKFRIGDNVKITAGKDKGRDGKIEKIFPKTFKVLVPGVNLYKKHVKGFQGQKGGIYDIPRPLGLGKIALICPKCKKVTRIGFSTKGEKKARICKKCNKEIDIK
ncbi:50S ribosomal protein L24 [Candidatus Woesebacteria bacterium CG22_combo_CG10-13_8_21_14_all_39_10]|uniref:Large ribosomal subunit protein uL24 n=4 Tax=Candidatus Woeseibacteriota TaxID=1752722 RepID=A0A2M7XA42_9BACT|nr:MAG: 50S ribosomal protein L24 [Candidatus Woesebacteria bacterium CG22_combo_CG10-13_8_21_14_all_39_10]PIU71911.1 MAG: 50S ribosomal protein L24 [Candidatus Woesebacteria bacterium CG06_land_8_20_14_3_00_39_27]PIZ48693.1 MAG: 50S ribosomal protein L24 [Candidatus Woesebacteria bacterium CG_4_10_14_0_2_um_filter_39_14]PJA43032.1 MAG: 50S ribosomal protein L24 [Candidatus Woesebacteria bacterium CG_4_9_14_3_um_filter_39_10]